MRQIVNSFELPGSKKRNLKCLLVTIFSVLLASSYCVINFVEEQAFAGVIGSVFCAYLIACTVFFAYLIACTVALSLDKRELQNNLHVLVNKVNFVFEDVFYEGSSFVRLGRPQEDLSAIYKQGSHFFRIEFELDGGGRVTWTATPVSIELAKDSVATDIVSYSQHFQVASAGSSTDC